MVQQTQMLINNSFFLDFPPLSNEDINLIYNKSLLDKLIQNPLDDEGNQIVNLSDIDIKELTNLKKALKKRSNYKYSGENNLNRFGRIYHSSNIQQIPSVLRKTLTYESFYDVDICKAHPNILFNVCKHHNIECKELEKILNDEYIQNIYKHYEGKGYSKDEIKEKIIYAIFNDKCFDENFKKLNNEIHGVKDSNESIIYKLKILYPELDKYCKELKNYKGDKSFLAWFLQTIENRIITIAFHFFKSKGIKSGLILHDGLYIKKHKSYEDTLPLIFDLEKNIKEKFFDFDINFKLTDFENETLRNHKVLKDKVNLSEKHIIDAYLEYSKGEHKILILRKSLYICKENNLWEEADLADINDVFSDKNFIDFLFSNFSSKIDYTSSKEWENLYKYLKCRSEFKKKNDFEFDTNPQLLCFDNKKCIVLDKFNKKNPWVIKDLLPSDYCSMSCKFPLELENINLEYKNWTKNIIFNCFQDKDTSECWMIFLGASLYGEQLPTKKILINKGCGNNGRSFNTRLLNNVLGDYFGTFNSSYFVENEFDGGEIKSPEAVQNKKKRLCIANEPKSKCGFKKKSFDTDKIKSYTGGDYVKARQLYSNKIDEFINIANLVICLNQSLYLKDLGYAGRERIFYIPQDIKFVKNPKREDEKQRITDESFMIENKFKNHMISVLLDYWSKFVNNNLQINFSKQILETTNYYLNDKLDLFMNKFFTKTENVDDFVLLDDLYEILETYYLGNSDFKLGKFTLKDKLIEKGFNCTDKEILIKETNKRCRKYRFLHLKKNDIKNPIKFKDGEYITDSENEE